MSSSRRANVASSVPASIVKRLCPFEPQEIFAARSARGWPFERSRTMPSASFAIWSSSARSAFDRKSTSPARSDWKRENRRCVSTVRLSASPALAASRSAMRRRRVSAPTRA